MMHIRSRFNMYDRMVWQVGVDRRDDGDWNIISNGLTNFKDAIKLARIWINKNNSPNNTTVHHNINDTDTLFYHIHDINDDSEIAILILRIDISS